jgi:hypothetical protein
MLCGTRNVPALLFGCVALQRSLSRCFHFPLFCFSLFFLPLLSYERHGGAMHRHSVDESCEHFSFFFIFFVLLSIFSSFYMMVGASLRGELHANVHVQTSDFWRRVADRNGSPKKGLFLFFSFNVCCCCSPPPPICDGDLSCVLAPTLPHPSFLLYDLVLFCPPHL